MIFAVAAFLLGMPVQSGPTTKAFISKPHGISLQIPQSWKQSQVRGATHFSIPIGSNTAELEIYDTNYRQPASNWQELQLTIAKQLGFEVGSQREEVIFGVPLLLTYSTKQSQKRVVGLLYTRTKSKFHFRLDAPGNAFDEAEQEFRTALVTLRTLNDQPFLPEDGVSEPIAPPKPSTDRVFSTRIESTSKAQYGPLSIDVKAANRVAKLRYEKEWTITGANDEFTVKHNEMPIEFKLQINNTIDSPVAGTAILDWAQKNLDEFQSVKLRENKGPLKSKSLTDVFYIYRSGTNAAGVLNAFAGVGANSDFYWMFNYSSSDETSWPKIRKLLEKFSMTTGFESVP